jgi:hypothetical protein
LDDAVALDSVSVPRVGGDHPERRPNRQEVSLGRRHDHRGEAEPAGDVSLEIRCESHARDHRHKLMPDYRIFSGSVETRRKAFVAAACLTLTLRCSPVSAQSRYDIGLLGGWTKASAEGSVLQFNFGTTYEVSFAWRIWASDRIDFAIEVPFFATNSLSIKTPGASLPREYAVLSLAPGVRLMLQPRRRVSVFGAVGSGFAGHEESALRADGNPNPDRQTNNTGAVSFGGGVDVKGGSWLGLRGEVRDVITGARRFSIPTPGERVHNVVTTLGLVVRF